VNINGYSYVYGGTIPAALWRDYMTVAMDGLDPTPFPTPTLTGSIGPETPVVVPSPEPEPTESPEPEPTESPEPEPPPSPDPEPPPSPDPEPPPEEPPGEEAQVATLPRRTTVARGRSLS
jgi:membrane peptidoglycan carboxypeptidase